MAEKPPFVLHQPKHQHPDQHPQHPHHARLPVIPDLRFEHSYLRSIRPYVTIRSTTDHETTDAHHNDTKHDVYEEIGQHDGELQKLQPSTLANVSSEVIQIQWGRVLWITTRDQVISPLLQGALWALASYFLTPFSSQLGTSIGTFARTHMSPTKEGSGVGWLRNWASGLGFGGMTQSGRRA